MDTYPYLEVGDSITLDTTTGITGLAGTVKAVDLDDDGRLRCLSLEALDPRAGLMLLRIPGTSIALWREGAPVEIRQPPQGLAIPNGIPVSPAPPFFRGRPT